MPKYDPYRKLRQLKMEPDGMVLRNKHKKIIYNNSGAYQIANDDGIVFNVKPNQGVRVLATSNVSNLDRPFQYTLGYGKSSVDKNGHFVVQLTDNVPLKRGTGYAVLFDESDVVTKLTPIDLIREKYKKLLR